MLRAMSRFPLLGFVLFVLFQAPLASAKVTLPALVSDGMVLQQKAPVRIWGWAADGEKVTVSLRGQKATAEARKGQWSVTLKPLDPGGPFELGIAGENQIAIKDVYVGEVWVCSGQSNMEFELARSFEAKGDIEATADPALRMFTVGRQLSDSPKDDVAGGKWEGSAPNTRGHFSAVGYYFGRALRQARGVPVGLIHSSWGGTPAEAWTSRRALEKWGMSPNEFAVLAPPSADVKAAYERALAAWTSAGKPNGLFDDPGLTQEAKGWSASEIDKRGWRAQSLPQAWEKLGPELQVDGGVWYRRELNLPEKWAGQALELSLGAIDDTDATYFNGVRVGATGNEVPNHWQVARRYPVPASAVRAGRAVVAVRVWDHGGDGGFTGPANALWIAPVGAEESERIPLNGQWRYKLERTRPSMPSPPGLDQNLPSVLYNGMLAPLLPYTVRGATWYQGESNAGRAGQYRALLGAMIRSWREDWRSGDFPFLIVQLAPFMAIAAEPEESGWAALREAQVQVTRDLPKVGVAVITDVGDEKDIHPTRKRPVGERLALAARKIAYGERIVASGPSFRSAQVGKGKITLSFENVGKGLEVRGATLTGFAIAGKDEKFVNADASIVGSGVVVSSPRVASPAYVRFGWANYPVVNLWNKEGLPAVPFRTDPP
jgi:sialate O-acetylesterase